MNDFDRTETLRDLICEVRMQLYVLRDWKLIGTHQFPALRRLIEKLWELEHISEALLQMRYEELGGMPHVTISPSQRDWYRSMSGELATGFSDEEKIRRFLTWFMPSSASHIARKAFADVDDEYTVELIDFIGIQWRRSRRRLEEYLFSIQPVATT